MNMTSNTAGRVDASAELSTWFTSQSSILSAQIQAALRATMFTNRFEMRPAQFGRIAAEEARLLCEFVVQPTQTTGKTRGEQLCRMGLGEEALLAALQATHRFIRTHAPAELQVAALEVVDNYHSGLIRGFMAAHTSLTLEEQERIRSAIQRTVSRYAVQMAVAAEVASAATSILDLDQLLQTASKLIRERFGLYYVAVFLADTTNRWAYLQASSGEADQVFLRRGHRLKIGGDSLVGWCIANGEAKIALDVGEKALSFDTPLLTDIHSEMVIPLISRAKVIGAMAIQSRQVGAFSEQDIAVVRITADQLANAIENARLFRERERKINELALLNEMGRALSAALDFDSLLETVHQQVGRIYDASHFSITTYNSENDTWKVVYDCRDGVRLPVVALQRGADLISYVARHRLPMLLGNRRELSAFVQLHPVHPPHQSVRSWMGVPLIAADRVVGVMTIASTTQEDHYSEQDLVIFTTIAAQTAVAMENARLYEQLRHELQDRMRAAEELRQAKESAESASRAKSTFLANMSHELRTPLTGIIGYSELLQREALHYGYNNVVPDLRKIHAAGTHLLSVINDILDLSKIESGKMDLFLETFSAHALLEDVQATSMPLIEKNRNRLTAVVAENLGLIHTDLTKVRQIVLNLVSNAAKFTENGLVTLSADWAQWDGKQGMRISVTDTGIGISDEQLGKLFKDFTQADASMTRKYGGTGLGLALSQKLCEMLDGKIEVLSSLGAGSTFTVYFPVSQAEPLPGVFTEHTIASPRPTAEAATTSKPPAIVLVIDDDPHTREFLSRCLGESGLDVVTAASGEEGIELARVLHPAVITLDVQLPGINGMEVLTEMKRDPELATIPVVMLTIVDEREHAYVLGASDYLIKPINCQGLIDVVLTYRSSKDHTH